MSVELRQAADKLMAPDSGQGDGRDVYLLLAIAIAWEDALKAGDTLWRQRWHRTYEATLAVARQVIER